MNEGKFYSPDPESGRPAPIAQPQVPFTTLVQRVATTRLTGQAAKYDAVWLTIEALVNELDLQNTKIKKLEAAVLALTQ